VAPVAAVAGAARTPGVGAAVARHGSPVNLDGLPPDHVRVLLDGLPIFERHGLLLAGGYAFRAHEILHHRNSE
jgi:hypothetical protein